MQPSLEKLRKFFRLEAERGYSNDAIIGGLAKMLDYWEEEARADGLPESLIAAVAARLRDYERLSPNSRKEALTGLWQRIKRETNQEEAPAAAPTRPSTTPRQRQPRARASQKHPGGVSPDQPAALDAALTVLPGIGPRNAKRLAALGLHTLGDMLYYFPRRYDDYTQLKPIKDLWYGEQVTVIGQVKNIFTRSIRGGKASLTEIIIQDGTAALRLSFFNQPWMANRYAVHDTIVVSGKVEQYLGRLVMNNPDIEPVETRHLHTNRIVPIYSLTANISQKWLREKIASVVQFWAPRVHDPVPAAVLQAADLLPLGEALLQIHLPDSHEKLAAARRRLAFDEIFYLQLGVLRQKQDWQSAQAEAFSVSDDWVNQQLQSLPFTLTQAQMRVLAEIRADLATSRPMTRLVQGDVGSGKTVVAALAAAIVAQGEAQTAVMAPTAILAEQHYKSFQQLLAAQENSPLPPEAIRLLVSSTPAAERRAILADLESGRIKVLIGTHALIESPVHFHNLQLAIIDEQHRFGVAQRAALRQKGSHPHLLVMTATPIPRSLALTIYGDLDLSVIDEMPAGRQPVRTYVLTPRERERAYTLIRGQLQAGRQAFIIYPLIEESEKSNLPAAVTAHKTLQEEVFPNYQVGLLHGRMKAEEKENIMQAFRAGQFQVLVSTTVVEVGVDVPNATVMLIEGANRFGLAQLHQLRGRVGRGGGEAYCLLIPEHEDAAENERLQAMAQTNDGFQLAEYDLKQRGPGEFLGLRQAGFSSLRMASLSDTDLIATARSQAEAIFAADPQLQAPEHQSLVTTLNRFWQRGQGDIS